MMKLLCVLIVFGLFAPLTAQEDNPIFPASSASQLEVLTLLFHESQVIEAFFSTTGTYFVSATLDGTFHVWQAGEHPERLHGERLYTIENYTPGVSLAHFDENDTQIALVLDSPEIQIRQAETGEILTTFAGHTAPVSDLYFLTQETMLSRDFNDTVLIWDAKTGEQLTSYELIAEIEIQGSTYALLDREGKIYLHTADEVYEVESGAKGMTLSPDERWIATWEDKVAIRNTENGEIAFELENIAADNILWTPDSRFFIIQGFDTAEIRSVESGERTDIFNRPGNGIETLMLSPDGDIAVTLDHDRRPRLWRLQEGTVAQIGSLPALVDRIEISPDGETLVGFQVEFETKFWWAETGFKGGETRLIPDSTIFSPDWRLLAAYVDTIVVWYGFPDDNVIFENRPIGHPARRSYVYPLPSEQLPFIAGLDADRRLFALARTYDSQWLKIIVENATVGWVKTETVAVEGNIAGLPLVRTGRIFPENGEILLAVEANGENILSGCLPEQTVLILEQKRQHYRVDCGNITGWIAARRVALDG